MTAATKPVLRAAGHGDAEVLLRIYASTREEELAQVPWDAATKEAFLRMQFTAQDTYYRATYPGASYDLVVSGEQVLGRLYVDRSLDAWLVLDIALLPEHRGSGIGTLLLSEVLAEADVAGKCVQMHVERFNPAKRLYDRLGFRFLEEQGIYLLLQREPDQPKTAS